MEEALKSMNSQSGFIPSPKIHVLQRTVSGFPEEFVLLGRLDLQGALPIPKQSGTLTRGIKAVASCSQEADVYELMKAGKFAQLKNLSVPLTAVKMRLRDMHSSFRLSAAASTG